MKDTPDQRTWAIERCGVGGGPGLPDATLVVVGPDGDVAVLADIEGAAASGSAELSVQLVSGRPPPEVVGELARAAAELAAASGATRMVVALAPCDRVAHDAVEASGLDWRMLVGGGSACAEVILSPVVPPSPGPGRTGS